MSWEHVAVHTPVNCPEYRWDLDEYRNERDEQMIFAHLAVFSLHPSLIKRMLETWRLFRQHVTCPIFAVGEVDDDKWERFIKLFHFQYLQDVVCNNGEPRRMFVSYSKNNNHGQQFTEPNPEHQPSRERGEHHEPVGQSNPVPATGFQRSGKRA